jgi:hypothetical protein
MAAGSHYVAPARTAQKYRFQQFFYCWMTLLSARTAQKTPFLFCMCNRYADVLFTAP